MKEFACDIETLGLDSTYNTKCRITAIGFYGEDENVPNKSYYWDEGKEIYLSLLSGGYIPIFHNASFDLGSMYTHGVDFPSQYHDTQLMSYLLEPKRYAGHALGKLARIVGEYKAESPDFGLGEADEDLLDYNEVDVRITWKLFKHFYPQLRADRQLYALYNKVEIPFIQALVDMKQTGMYLDLKQVHELLPVFRKIRAELYNEAVERVGGFVPGKKGGEQLSMSRPAHVFYYIFMLNNCQLPAIELSKAKMPEPFIEEFTEEELAPFESQGVHYLPKMNAGIIEQLEEENVVGLELLTEYRKVEKLINTYLEGYSYRTNPVLRTNLNNVATWTGRLSSSNPPMQNIPRTGEKGSMIRKLFTVPEGYTFVGGDLSNIEARVLAFLLQEITGDDSLARVFIEGTDFHSHNVEKLGIKDSSKQGARDNAKKFLYTWLYGGGTGKIAEGMGVPYKEAKELIDSMSDTWPTLVNLKSEIINIAQNNNGIIHDVLGRRLVYKDILSHDRVARAKAERQLFNACLQGANASIIKYLTVQSMDVIRAWQAHLMLQVHDELLLRVPEYFADVLIHELTPIWNPPVPGLLGDIPIVCEFKKGLNWGETH